MPAPTTPTPPGFARVEPGETARKAGATTPPRPGGLNDPSLVRTVEDQARRASGGRGGK